MMENENNRFTNVLGFFLRSWSQNILYQNISKTLFVFHHNISHDEASYYISS